METTTTLGYLNPGFFNRALLEIAKPYLPHSIVTDKKNLPASNTKTMVMRRYSALAAATTPRVEGVNPAGSSLSFTDITVDVATYGDFIPVGSMAETVAMENLASELTQNLLGPQAGLSVDNVARDVFCAGSSVRRATGATTRATIAALLTVVDLKVVWRALRNQNAMFYDDMINGSTNVATTPIRSSYFCIMHPDIIYTARDLTGPAFNPVHLYAQPGQAHPNEVGELCGFRIIESTNAKIFYDESETNPSTTYKSASGSATDSDVYASLCFGQHAVGEVELSGGNLQMIHKDKAQIGGALEMYSTYGWKVEGYAAKILNDAFMYRVETLAAA